MSKLKGSASTRIYTEEGRDNHDATFGKKPLTMNDKYGDGSDHAACAKCGMCIVCGDCTCESNKEGGHMPRSEIGQGLHEIANVLKIIASILSFIAGSILFYNIVYASDLNTCVYKGFYVNEKGDTLYTMFTCLTDESEKQYLIGEIIVYEHDSRDQDERDINQALVRN